MTAVTVTLTVGTTIHYWFVPKADEASGFVVPEIVYGWTTENLDGTPSTLSLSLDSDFTYDVRIDGRGVPPVVFPTFKPSDGELLSLLSAQGWVSL